MEKIEIEKYVSRLKRSKEKCLINIEAYDIWLSVLVPLRWIAITIGVIFPAFAGFAIFSQKLGAEWKVWSAWILLISGIVTGFHTALKCNSHQEECKKLMVRYEALADEYGDAIDNQPDDIKSVYETLGNELYKLKKDSATKPAKWCFSKAKKKLNFIEKE